MLLKPCDYGARNRFEIPRTKKELTNLICTIRSNNWTKCD